MNKLTPTKVFEIVDDEDKSTAAVSNFNISLMVRETNDKYLLSREELEELLSNTINECNRWHSSNLSVIECKQQYLKTIL